MIFKNNSTPIIPPTFTTIDDQLNSDPNISLTALCYRILASRDRVGLMLTASAKYTLMSCGIKQNIDCEIPVQNEEHRKSTM